MLYWLVLPVNRVVAATSAEAAVLRVSADCDGCVGNLRAELCPLDRLRRHLGLAEPRAPPA